MNHPSSRLACFVHAALLGMVLLGRGGLLAAEEPVLHPVAVVKGGYFAPCEQVQHLLRGVELKRKTTDKAVAEALPLVGDPIELGYAGLDPAAVYRITLRFIADVPRTVRVRAGDGIVEAAIAVDPGPIVERTLTVPPTAYARGTLLVAIDKVQGPDVLLVEATLHSTNPAKPEPYPVPEVVIPRLSPRPSAVAGCAALTIDLAGTWKFHPNPAATFPEKPVDGSWSDIAVPGEWWMQGFEVKPGTPAGYARTFTVPADWQGKRIKLRCEAVYSEAVVWVNGKRAGSHVGGFTQFELDITDLTRAGAENLLAMTVLNEGPADTLTCGSTYACHPLGGILRPIRLLVMPEINLAALRVTTSFAVDFKDAVLKLDLGVAREGSAKAVDIQARLALIAPDGKPVAIAPDRISFPGQEASVAIPVAAPLKWDTEHPRLHTLEIRLEADGVCVETIAQQVGFRQIDLRGNQLLVNGLPVKLRGVNRHETHPTAGRALPPGFGRMDLELFREANVNHMRTSHYPPGEEFLQAADELGMFIECEAPFCWAVGCGSTELVCRQTGEMAMAYRNHPSILFWSLANESKWGTQYMASSDLLHRLDPTRPHNFNDNGSKSDPACTGIMSSHYGAYKDIELTRKGLPQPFYHGEDSHMNCYNRQELATDPGVRDLWGIHLLKLWEQMYATPGNLGQSIWAGIDDVFFTRDGQTIECRVWGIIDGWRRKRPEWWNVKKVYSPIRILDHDTARLQERHLDLQIENRQNFANLSEMAITWRTGDQSGMASADIPPHGKGRLRIDLAQAPRPGDALELTFTDPRGFMADQYRLPLLPVTVARIAPAPCATTFSESADRIAISSGSARWEMDRRGGQFIAAGGRPMQGPFLCIVPLSDAGGTQAGGKPKVWEPLTAPCKGWSCQSVAVRQEGSDVLVTVAGTYEVAKGTYELRFANGRMQATYAFAITKPFNADNVRYLKLDQVNPRQFGVAFALPASCDTLTWERKGLWDTYPDDHIARLTGRVTSSEGHEATAVGPMTRPDHPWRLDNLPYGNNDFCSTKHNVITASLSDAQGSGLVVDGGGRQHVRTWNTGKQAFLLVADYSNGGLGAYLHRLITYDRHPLKVGDTIKGTVDLGVAAPR